VPVDAPRFAWNADAPRSYAILQNLQEFFGLWFRCLRLANNIQEFLWSFQYFADDPPGCKSQDRMFPRRSFFVNRLSFSEATCLVRINRLIEPLLNIHLWLSLLISLPCHLLLFQNQPLHFPALAAFKAKNNLPYRLSTPSPHRIF